MDAQGDLVTTSGGAEGAAARWIGVSRSTHAFRLDERGTVVEANTAARERLAPGGDVVGRPLADVASESQRVLSAGDGEELLVTFSRGDVRYTLNCHVFVDGAGRWLVGEPVAADAALETELRRANNELAVLARDYAHQAVELREALEERERARWTLQRIGEVLPVCMSCGELRTETDGWQSASAFLMENGVPLSHGYCPPCEKRVRIEFAADLA